MTNPEEAASLLLEDLGIDSYPINPLEICSTLGIHVFEESFDGIEGVLLFDGSKASIGLNKTQTYLPRKKFSVAHELGHFSMDINYGETKIFKCSKKMIETFDKTDNMELRADQFASELILPSKLVRPFFNKKEPSWEIVKEVSNQFEVSLLPASIKFINTTNLSCCLVVSSQNQIKFYRPSKKFRYSMQMDSRILSSLTFAHAAMAGNPIPDDFSAISADNWISGINVSADSEIYEWSLPLNSFGTVLTILWDNDSVSVETETYTKNNSYDEDEKNYSYDGVDNFPWEPPTLGRSKKR